MGERIYTVLSSVAVAVAVAVGLAGLPVTLRSGSSSVFSPSSSLHTLYTAHTLPYSTALHHLPVCLQYLQLQAG